MSAGSTNGVSVSNQETEVTRYFSRTFRSILDVPNNAVFCKCSTLMESHFGQKRSSFSRTVENFLGRSRIFSDGREFPRTVENFLGRSRIFSDGREFFWDNREFSRTGENFLERSRIFINCATYPQFFSYIIRLKEKLESSRENLDRPRKI